MRRKIAAGNWKMHGLAAALDQIDALAAARPDPRCDVLLCVPATLIAAAQARGASIGISVGGQDCHPLQSGAHTGDIAAEMLADAGASAVIVGHSERRGDHGETDENVRAKAEAAIRAGLDAIVCIGETLVQRDAGRTEAVLGAQLTGSLPERLPGGLVVAYEPIWAIGTGKSASPAQIADTHAFIRAHLAMLYGEDGAQRIPILYGGSVKAQNAAEIFAVGDVDGALVGGASLRAADFAPIVDALSAA